MRAWLILLALAFGYVCAEAETTVSVGATHPYLQDSGTWWQQEFSHSLPKDVPSVGIRYDKRNADGYSWGAGYTYVGRFRSHAKAIASDEYYNAWDRRTPYTYPLSDWYGDQTVHAVYLIKRHYNGKAFFEAGPVVTYSKWSMTIPNWIHCVDPACMTPGMPEYLKVGKPKQWQVLFTAGMGYQLTPNAALRLQFYPTFIRGEFPGITQRYSPTITFDYTF